MTLFDFEYIERSDNQKSYLLPKTNYRLSQTLKDQLETDPYKLTNSPRALQRYTLAISLHAFAQESFEDFSKRNDKTQESTLKLIENTVFKDSLLSRITIHRTLSDYAEYVILNNDKTPVYNKYRNKTKIEDMPSRLFHKKSPKTMIVDTPPMEGGYGIRPKQDSRLYILDIDIPKALKNLPESDLNKKELIEDYLKTSLNLLSKKLKTNLFNTITQYSASGGIHVFLLLPESIKPAQLPAANLRPYKALHEDLGFTLDADVRSGAAHGYVVGPGSEIFTADGSSEKYVFAVRKDSAFKNFLLGRKQTLKTISLEGITWLRNIRISHEQDKLNKKIKLKFTKEDALRMRYNRGVWDENQSREDMLEDEISFQSSLNLYMKQRKDVKVSQEQVSSVEELEILNNRSLAINYESKGFLSADKKIILEHKLKDKENLTFHARRAYVFRALSCCLDSDALLDLCKDLEINRDSYYDSELSHKLLVDDFTRFIASYGRTINHGGYCSNLQKSSLVKEMTKEERAWFKQAIEANPKLSVKSLKILYKSHERIKSLRKFNHSFKKRNSRVLDLISISEVLGKDSHKVTQVQRDSFLLMVAYFNPLLNLGMEKVIVNRKFLEESFSLSKSRVSAALRFLREKKIIKVAVKQVTGMAPLYSVNLRYSQNLLTSLLKKTWGASKVTHAVTGRDYFLSAVYDPYSGKFLRPDDSSYSHTVLDDYTSILHEIFNTFGFNCEFDFIENAFSYSEKVFLEYSEAKASLVAQPYDFTEALARIAFRKKNLEAFFTSKNMVYVSATIVKPQLKSKSELLVIESESKTHFKEFAIVALLRAGNAPP